MNQPSTNITRRWQFTLRALLFVMLCIAGILSGFRTGYYKGFQTGHDKGTEQRRLEVYSTKVYQVSDDSAKSMIGVIVRTIDRESWSDIGGRGAIDVSPDDPGAIVVLQNDASHDAIGRLLSDLRKAKQSSVEVTPVKP
jgi:hypothetical protein